MALSGALARNNTPAERLDVSATVSFEKVEAGWRVTRSALTLKGSVPGLDAAALAEHANGAKSGCPISAALAGNVEITLAIVA
jgi:osmotically inducible protein OsmC